MPRKIECIGLAKLMNQFGFPALCRKEKEFRGFMQDADQQLERSKAQIEKSKQVNKQTNKPFEEVEELLDICRYHKF